MFNTSKYIFLFLFICISFSVAGMNRIDSLSHAMQGIHDETELVKTKLKLIAELIDNDEIQRAETLINEVRFKKLSSLQKGELLYDEGMIYQAHYDYSNAMKMFLEATKVAVNEENINLKNASDFRIAELFLKQNEQSQSISIVESILKKGSDDKIFLSQCHELLGDAYYQQKIFGKAKFHFKSALDLKIATKQYEGAANLASFMGEMSRDLEEFDEAINYHRMSLNWHQSQGNNFASANDYYQMALVHTDADEFEEGLENVDAAIKLINALEHPVQLASFFALKGRIYAKKGDKSKSLLFLNKSRDLLNSNDRKAEGFSVLENISETCHIIGDDKMAFKVHKEFVEAEHLNGSMLKAKELETMKMRFESEFQSEKVKREIEKLELKNAYNNRVRYFLITLLAMMSMLIFYVSKSLRLKKKTNLILSRRNATIEAQAKEISAKNEKLESINDSLEALNGKLVIEISERESIEHSSFSRDKFLAAMSQEMKTPLTAIMGLTNMLIEDNPRPEQMNNLRSLQFSANDLAVFVNDILDYSKIEAGKLSLIKREFKLSDVVDDICNRFDAQFDTKDVTFVCEYDSNIPKVIFGDDVRMNQIMTNFISFALSDAKTSHIKSTIKLQNLEENRVEIDFGFWFDGEKISEDRIKKLFRKENIELDGFERYPRRLLGMTIAKRLIDLQDGNFEIFSSTEDGTHMKYKLCFKLLDADRIIYSKEEQVNMLKNKRILVVEDNKINQIVVANMLTKLGMEVVTADNGQEGLNAIASDDFDLVLMDIQMPIMDGYKATSEIRKLPDPSKNQVPIIALTASAFLTESEKAQLFGMDDHVGKPFSLDDLVDKITVLLMGKQQSGQ